MKQVVVVGAGLGGLSAALHARAAGAEVLLLEKNQRVGGKLNLVQQAGFTFDTGPSLFTMPWVLREVLAAAGRTLEAELTLLPLDPSCRYHWIDGTTFNARSDMAELVAEIEQLEPRDVEGFFRFMAFAARIYHAAAEPFLLEPFEGLRTMLQPRLIRDVFKIAPLETVDHAVRRFFRSPYLQQVFNRYATYNGSSPYRSPATFAIIPYVEIAQGSWYIKGGMYELARVLERIIREQGVELRLNSAVERVETQNGRATGVRLADGSFEPADYVIVNADALYALEHLLPTKRPDHPLSCSGFVMLLGVNRDFPQLSHHNIFFSQDYPAEFRAIWELGIPAPDPTIYVAATCRADPEHAPPGMLNLFVLVNAPATNQRVNWPREASAYRDLVIRHLERHGLLGLNESIISEKLLTPLDLASMTNAWRGALYGPASHGLQAAFLRPQNRVAGLNNVALVGGATHPGGGIPLVLLSGRTGARWALQDS